MYIASSPRRFLGQSVGNGQCVAFARAAAGMGHTSTWHRGQRVRGAVLAPGTAIATFDDDGTYANHTDGRSHAAIYLGQDATGIIVLDQWVEVRPMGQSTKRYNLFISGTSDSATARKPSTMGETTMLLNSRAVLAVAAIFSSSIALADARVDCPSTHTADGKPRKLNRISIFDGPPEDLADLMPDLNTSEWDITFEQQDAKVRGASLFLVCRYVRTKQVVTLAIPAEATLCKLEGTRKGWAGWCKGGETKMTGKP